MLRIAICDDERVHREYTARLTEKELAQFLPEIDAFDSAEALLRAMSEGDYAPGIAILDIQMGEIDGITLARRLNELAPLCRIIFLTSYLTFATDVYSTEHIYFIVKSEVETRIGPALQKAVTALSAGKTLLPSVTIQGRQIATVIPAADIFLMERIIRKTRIATASGNVWAAQTPQELLQGVIADCFIRCHQSYWVNIGKITSLKNNEFHLSDGTIIPLSRTFRGEGRERFFASLRGESMDFGGK